MSKKINLVYDGDGAYGSVLFSSPKADEIWVDMEDLTFINRGVTFRLVVGELSIEDLSKKHLKRIKKEIERVLDGLD